MNRLCAALCLSLALVHLRAEDDRLPTEQDLSRWLKAASRENIQTPGSFDADIREKQDRVERGIPLDEPELRFTLADDYDTNADPRSVSALRIPLPNPWLRRAEKAGQVADLHLARASAAEQQLERDWACLQTGVNLQYLEADQELLQQQIHLQETAVTRARAMVDEGVITLPAVTRLQLDLLDTRQSLARNRQQFYEARRGLSVLTNLPTETIQVTPARLDPGGLNRYFPLDLSVPSTSLSPVLQARREQVEAGRAEVNASRIPWFEHVQARVESSNKWEDTDYADLQVAISLPIFAWFDDGKQLADETLAVMDAYEAYLLDQQSQLQQDRIRELKAALPELKKQYQEIQNLEDQLQHLQQQAFPLKEKLTVDDMALRLIDLQRELLRQQQGLELRIRLLKLAE